MTPEGPGKKIFLMNTDLPGAGFGACVLATINQIRFCERRGFLPVAVYDRNSTNAFFDPDYGNSMWEQYFEPLVAGWSAHAVKQYLEDSAHGSLQDVLAPASDEEFWGEAQHPDAVASFTYGEWRSKPPEDLLAWYAQQRIKARETVSKYIQPSQRIRDKVEVFWRKNVSPGFVLGIHMRGTDLHYAPPVSPAEYFPVIEQWIEREPDLTLFLATEQTQYYELMHARYGGRLIAYDVARSDDDVAPFNMESVSPYKRGEDVLLDILFLSRCNHLLKGASNVGEMAMYFGPDLQCTDLSLGKVKAFGQDYGERWDFHASKPAWALLKKTDLTSLAENAASQNLLEWAQNLVRRMTMLVFIRPVRRVKRFALSAGNSLARLTRRVRPEEESDVNR